MTDGLGSMSYAYNQLSRMTSETRVVAGVGNYTISYQYNLANQLSSITNPHGSTVSYARDAAGRVTGVTGTAVPTYTSNIQYRAWGAVKHRNHPNGWSVDSTYNSLMQPASFTVTSRISKTYEYWADGRLRFSSDHRDHRFDRYYGFDHAGRISEAFSGAEARFEPPTTDRPYRQTYSYDGLGHLAAREMKRWYLNWSMSDSYTNNRRVGWGYDADGRLTSGPEGPFTHDAAGRNTYLDNTSTGAYTGVFGYDGDGRLVKTEESTWDPNSFSYSNETKHFVRSSVLGGQVLTELLEGASGTYIYAGTTVFAREVHFFGGSTFLAWWEDKDPSGATVWLGGLQQELDPTGADNGTFIESVIPDEGAFASYGSSYNPANPSMTYSTDGIRVTLDDFILRMGRVAKDPTALMELVARQSVPRLRNYEVSIYNGRLNRDFGLNLNRAIGEALETGGTLIRNWLVDDSWALTSSLLLNLTQQPQNSGINHSKILNDTIERVKKRLTGDCLKLFAGIDPSNYLANYVSIGNQTYAGTPFSSSELTLASTQSDTDAEGMRLGSGHTVFNQDSAFFTGTVAGQPFPGTVLNNTSSMYGLSLDQIREVAVLHELFHVHDVGSIFDDDTGDAATDLMKTKAINKLIRKECGFP